MPTRLYFHDAAWTGSGTPPAPITTGLAVGNSTLINNAAGVSTPRVMDTNVGAGPHVNVAVATRATTSSQATIYRMFVSAPFAASYTFQTSATATYYWNVADSETNLNVNHSANLAHVYVYRPSTGAIVGEIGLNTISSFLAEPSAASTAQVSESSRTTAARARSSNFQALEGDVIVVQMAAVFAQGMGTAYSTSFYYDGNTTNATENATVTNHASYLEFSATLPLSVPALPPVPMGAASGAVSSSASGTLSNVSDGAMFASGVVSATASADLLVVQGPWLIADPLLTTASAAGTLTNGPNYISGTAKARSTPRGPGLYVEYNRFDSPVTVEYAPYVLANGRWLSVRESGANFYVAYSDDEGRSWTLTNRQAGGVPKGFASNAANTRIVSDLGYSGVPYYSDNNGVTWTVGTGTSLVPQSRIIFGNGKFVRFVSDGSLRNGRAQYSTDGIAWSLGTLFSDTLTPSVALYVYAEGDDRIWYDSVLGKFVALAFLVHEGEADFYSPMSSTDGITWTIRSDVNIDTQLSGKTDVSQVAMYNGVLATGTRRSTDGGITWTNSSVVVGTHVYSTSSGFIAVQSSPAGAFASEGPVTAYLSTDGNAWTATPIDGAPALFSTLADRPYSRRSFHAQDKTRSGEILLTGDATGVLTGAITISTRPVLTVSGTQLTQLMGWGRAVTALSTPTLRDRPQPLFEAAATGVATASATTLIDANPFVQTLRATSTVLNAALTTSIRLSANLLSRSRPLGGGIVEEAPFFGIGTTAYASTTGWVVTPTRRRNPTTGLWSATTPPDGTNAPVLLASDGGGVFCAFSSVGPVTYSSTDGAAWTVGSAIPAPPPGWGAMTDFGLTGGNGRFVLYARSGLIWYTWVSTNGRTWTTPQVLTQPYPDTLTALRVIGYAGGFVGVFTGYGTLHLTHSVDGTSWVLNQTVISYSADQGGLTGYSAGVLSHPISSGSGTLFIDLQKFVSGGVIESVIYPTKDTNVPGAYWRGDPYSTRPTFYSARTTGFDTLVDPLAPGITHTYTPNRWAKPSLLTLTGDYEVFDGTLYARAIRTSDSAEVGATANIGPALYSSSIALAGSAQAQATLSGALPSIHALASTASGAASASATLLTRQPISASASAVSSATAILQAPVVLAGSAAAVSASAGTLTVGARFIADAAGQATATAALTTSIRLAGALATQSSAAASTILVPKPLVASATSAVSATAALTVFRPVQAVPKAQATAQAALTTQIRLQANGAAAASADGDLLVGSLMRAAVAGEAIVAADLTAEILLGGDLVAAAEATASLMLQVLLDSALTVECLAEGDLTTGVDLRAHVQAVVTTHAILRRFIPVDARKDPLRHLERRSGTVATQFEEGLVHLARGGAVTHTGRDVQAVHTTIDEPLISLTTDEN